MPLTSKEKTQHSKLYDFYNYLFGDRREYMKEYYQTNREYILSKKRKDDHSQKVYAVQTGYCNLNCENCKFDDCILPEYSNKTEYFRLYKKNHKEQIKQYNQKYYNNHKEEIRRKQIIHRAKPEIIEKRREYNKKYYELHKETEKLRIKKWKEEHRDEINARRREKRRLQRMANNVPKEMAKIDE